VIRRVRRDELSPDPAPRSPRASAPHGARADGEDDADADARAAMAALFAEQHALAPEAIVRLVARELARFRGAHDVCVRVHPEDARRLPAPERLAAGLTTPPSLREDASLTPGGCMVTGFDTETGPVEVDARVETRIARALAFARGALP